MDLDPLVRELLVAIRDALVERPAPDRQAQLNTLASQAFLVRQQIESVLSGAEVDTATVTLRTYLALPEFPTLPHTEPGTAPSE